MGFVHSSKPLHKPHRVANTSTSPVNSNKLLDIFKRNLSHKVLKNRDEKSGKLCTTFDIQLVSVSELTRKHE
jgi:hypothetical protein